MLSRLRNASDEQEYCNNKKVRYPLRVSTLSIYEMWISAEKKQINYK